MKVAGGSGFPPPAYAVLMETTDEPKEELILLSLEVPLACSLPPGIEKQGLERIHIERLASDVIRTGLAEQWDVRGAGGDPPDFRVEVDGMNLGVELTAFSSQARRRGHAEFRRVRSALLEEGPRGFDRLRGHLVYFWASSGDRPGAVATPADRVDIVSGLRSFTPMPLGDDPSERIPQTMPDLGVGRSEPWSYLAVPWEGPATGMLALMGFDIGICIESAHSAGDAVAEVQRLVSGHDAEGNDVLAIQVGAPDRNGLIYPTEEVVMDVAIHLLRRDGIRTEHIPKVLIHYWRRGEVVEIKTLPGG